MEETWYQVLRSHISGANLVELPLGTDHAEIKAAFDEMISTGI